MTKEHFGNSLSPSLSFKDFPFRGLSDTSEGAERGTSLKDPGSISEQDKQTCPQPISGTAVLSPGCPS